MTLNRNMQLRNHRYFKNIVGNRYNIAIRPKVSSIFTEAFSMYYGITRVRLFVLVALMTVRAYRQNCRDRLYR